MDESGVLGRIRDFYTPLNAMKDPEECWGAGKGRSGTAVALPVDMANASFPFCQLILGLAVAVILGAMEKAAGRRRRRTRKARQERVEGNPFKCTIDFQSTHYV